MDKYVLGTMHFNLSAFFVALIFVLKKDYGINQKESIDASTV